jgi:5'-nucleotidase
MKILITNDDGIDAPGLGVLEKCFSKNNEVWVVAPNRNRSGVSHCITMDKPLYLEQRPSAEGMPYNENRYALEGFPADCVITALRGNFLPGIPDVVISGINNDANLGTDVIFSGTCAAARQASLYGVPGIALSLCHRGDHHDDEDKYEPLAAFISDHISTFMQFCGAKDNDSGGMLKYFVNVNALSLDSYKGYVLAGLSNREYRDSVEIQKDEAGRKYSVFCGGNILSYGDGTDDYSVVQNEYVAVSVLHTEAVCEGI